KIHFLRLYLSEEAAVFYLNICCIASSDAYQCHTRYLCILTLTSIYHKFFSLEV
ncbi:hypothetical protein ACJX0J_028527, partial [Zea mays]